MVTCYSASLGPVSACDSDTSPSQVIAITSSVASASGRRVGVGHKNIFLFECFTFLLTSVATDIL